MKILMINKFLHPNGGSETYIFGLGQALTDAGHEVQYFGMEHENRCVGNHAGAYTANMDFHGGSIWSKVSYPIKTIYSGEARRKIRKVLDDFKPDVCHLNNFNYQLTPSILLEIRKWERQCGRRVKILFTAHDYQLLCPNHMLNNPATHENCEKCIQGKYLNCVRGRCIHGSLAKSAVGMLEGVFWKLQGVYQQIDIIICPSRFMKEKMDKNPIFSGKTIAIHNFLPEQARMETRKQDYVLYFGRYSEEKGIKTLLQVCKDLPQIQFVFAGSGPLEEEVSKVPNIRNLGFLSGGELKKWIQEARFSVYPSQWYENCPFSVMESQLYGTPVLGADIGGIPELIRPGETGELFESGNRDGLRGAIEKLWNCPELTDRYQHSCRELTFTTPEQYCKMMLKLYGQN